MVVAHERRTRPCEAPGCSFESDFSEIEYTGSWSTSAASAEDYLGTLHTASSGAGFGFEFWGYVALIGPATCGTGKVTVGGQTYNVQAPCDGRRRAVLFEYANWGTLSYLNFTATSNAFALDGVVNFGTN